MRDDDCLEARLGFGCQPSMISIKRGDLVVAKLENVSDPIRQDDLVSVQHRAACVDDVFGT